MLYFVNGHIVLPNRVLYKGVVTTMGDRIGHVGDAKSISLDGHQYVDLDGGYLLPGFVDVHVHGGAGADFMDGTDEAFRTILMAHARHGTTSLTPTTTVARHDDHIRFLECVKRIRKSPPVGAKVLGAHLYGPYFAPSAVGCHPPAELRPPTADDYEPYLAFAEHILTATVAPELPGAEEFVRSLRSIGIRCNAGHTHATFTQMEQAIEWGIRHVDHLFCAMSDRARLRQTQTFPMRAGVMEATLHFDELSTEIIADGKHLSDELIRFAYKIKGPDRLAVVSDTMRAMDMPDGEYVFGPLNQGETIRKQDGVGLTLDGKSLASGVMGMDHGVRTVWKATNAPLQDIIRMASLTPAKILGRERDIGSIDPGKKADLLVTNKDLQIQRVFIDGRELPLTKIV